MNVKILLIFTFMCHIMLESGFAWSESLSWSTISGPMTLGRRTRECLRIVFSLGWNVLLLLVILLEHCYLHEWLSFAERVGVHVVECACVIELPELKACVTNLRPTCCLSITKLFLFLLPPKLVSVIMLSFTHTHILKLL